MCSSDLGGVCVVCVVVPSGGGGDVDEPLCFFFVYKIYIQ